MIITSMSIYNNWHACLMEVVGWSRQHHKGFVMAGIFTRKLKVEFQGPAIHYGFGEVIKKIF